MTPQEIELVQKSFAKVAPVAEQAAEMFYARLFELDASVKQLFTGDMKEQGKRLMAMISVAVKGLDHIEDLVPAVQELGRRHVDYGVHQDHYATVGVALLGTLEKMLGEDFPSEVKEAWSSVYKLLATTMMNAAASAQEEIGSKQVTA